MSRFIIQRIAILPFALVLVHFLAFSYAYYARPIRAAHTPYYTGQTTNTSPLFVSYYQHIQALFHGALLRPLEEGPQIGSFGQTLEQASVASLGLLAIVVSLSIILGLSLGLLAVRNQPPGVRGWMSVISTVGLSMPSFYIAGLCILLIIYVRVFVFIGPDRATPIPINGYGWDSHLILPVIALIIHPTVKIAQVTANLLEGELNKQYIIAARSFGHSWKRIRWREAMMNVSAPILISIAGSFRMLMGELVVVEWLFGWPGLGNLLASTLVPGTLSNELGVNALFLDPPTVAGDLTIIASLFIFTDLLVQVLGRMIDPRLRVHEDTAPGGVAG